MAERGKSVTVVCAAALLLLLFPVSRAAGQTSAPTLQRRDAQAVTDKAPAVTTGTSTLPPDVSGEYLLGDNGETIEIELEPKHLDGYVSILGDRTSDKGTPLTFFFKTSTLDGVEIGFTTHRIHETWYSFRGTIVRGAAQNPSAQGYYMLDGMLTSHDAVEQQEYARRVSLPLAAQSLP